MLRNKLEPVIERPVVLGTVLAARKNFVEISIGSDDGMAVGEQLDVFRDDEFLGRVIIRRVGPDRSVAEVIPELRKGIIQKGDKVRAKARYIERDPKIEP